MSLRKCWLAVVLGGLLLPVLPGAQETTVGNNLSYPAMLQGVTFAPRAAPGTWTLPAALALGTNYSWGCAKPEGTYPNTTCYSTALNPLSGWLSDAQCTAAATDTLPAGPCSGYAVEPIFWQQSDAVWAAGSIDATGTPQASYVDWADNLESVTWSERSIVRVETTPFTALPAVAGGLATQRGFQLWHVLDQGPDEMWGLHTTAGGDPYVYQTKFAIVNAPARLNIAKLGGPGTATTCPTALGTASPYVGALAWAFDATTGRGAWTGNLYQRDDPYTVELNIGGKFVYGFNWNLKTEAVPPAIGKTGWWRLTFYTGAPGSAGIDFSSVLGLAPPALENEPMPSSIYVDTPTAPPAPAAATLYTPTVDAANQLTYVDICIGSTRGGGSVRAAGGGE